jgi:hypothetical protein
VIDEAGSVEIGGALGCVGLYGFGVDLDSGFGLGEAWVIHSVRTT